MIDREKQVIRQNKWRDANKDRIELLVPKGYKEEWKAKADEAGLSLSEWITKKCQGD